MANENSRDPTNPKLQSIPLTKIHDLPGIPLVRQPDKSYGGLVTSIQSGGVVDPAVKERVRDELNQDFRPEVINRVDDIVVFSPLTESQIAGIIHISMASLVQRLADE